MTRLSWKPPWTFKTKFIIETANNRSSCIVCSRRAVIRIAPAPKRYGRIDDDFVNSHFPYGELLNRSTHVFSFDRIGKRLFMAALPVETVNGAIGACRTQGIKQERIDAIDLCERRMFVKYKDWPKRLWVCLEMEGGVRILEMDGQPLGAYFISDSPAHYELMMMTPPEEAVLYMESGWLRSYLIDKGVAVIDPL